MLFNACMLLCVRLLLNYYHHRFIEMWSGWMCVKKTSFVIFSGQDLTENCIRKEDNPFNRVRFSQRKGLAVLLWHNRYHEAWKPHKGPLSHILSLLLLLKHKYNQNIFHIRNIYKGKWFLYIFIMSGNNNTWDLCKKITKLQLTIQKQTKLVLKSILFWHFFGLLW